MAPKKRTKQGCALAAVPEEFADDLALAFPALSLSEPRSKMSPPSANDYKRLAEFWRVQADRWQARAMELEEDKFGRRAGGTTPSDGSAPISNVDGEQPVRCPACGTHLMLYIDLNADAAAQQTGGLLCPNSGCNRPLALKARAAS